MKLFVAKLNREVQDEHLLELFSSYGEVAYARVITDRDTGQSKCFGFVQMKTAEDGQKALSELNGHELMGFRMVVKEAEDRPRAARPEGEAPRPGSAASAPPVRRENPTEFSRQPDPVEPTERGGFGAPKKLAPKKSKFKNQRDIYADGPKPAKLKRTKTKRDDWLEDFDDFD